MTIEAQLQHPSDFIPRLRHRLRVRWAEVDMQRIVFNAHYLTYFDVAIAAYWRALALPYEEAMHALQGDIYLRKATLDFAGSARLDDELEVGLGCRRVGDTSMRFEGALFRQQTRLVTCKLVYVFADPTTQKSKAVPAPLRAAISAWESGEATFDVTVGDWTALGEAAGSLRQAVFVEEQQIPKELEWDEADATALHAVARNRLGQSIATCRLLPAQAGVARIGRMAVHRAVRGAGLGAAVLRALEQTAKARGDHAVALHAQRSAVAFYTRLGYAPHGDPFAEAGIEHLEMQRSL
ncbi:MAG: YbgC/FadM family acyl-CoA thioesterase [Variovorax sp.]